jgi:hypothetical protein
MESFSTAEGRGRARRPLGRLVALGTAAAMALVLLPGIASAAPPYPLIVVTPSATTVVAGKTLTFEADMYTSASTYTDITSFNTTLFPAAWSTNDPYPGITTNESITTKVVPGGDPAGVPQFVAGSPNIFCQVTPTAPAADDDMFVSCIFFTVGTVTVYAQDGVGGIIGSVLITVTPDKASQLELGLANATPKSTSPLAPETVGVADTATVKVYDQWGNVATGFADSIRMSSNDPLAIMPPDATLTNGVGTFSVTFGTTAVSWNLIATDTTNVAITDTTTVVVSFAPGSYYTPITSVGTGNPCRLVDTRIGLGLQGRLPANGSLGFLVSGRCGIPVGAVAVTGNITVTGSTAGWAVYVGPAASNVPASSSINFTAGQTKANSMTVGLSADGKLFATYITTTGNTTDFIFDVTGYYNAPVAITIPPTIPGGQAGFVALDQPLRVLDTRDKTGYSYGKISAGIPATFQVAPPALITPAPCGTGAIAGVTGNLTVTNPTSGWSVALTSYSAVVPTTSTINFGAWQTLSNSVTMGVDPAFGGLLSATYLATPGNTTDLVFDVTGYYCSTTGSAYMPITPYRVMDTRPSNFVYSNHPFTFKVAGTGGVPFFASAVTGVLTVTDETAGWALYVGPDPLAIAPTSNINFMAGDIMANGLTSDLNDTLPAFVGMFGDLSVTYISTPNQTTNFVFDATGYFVP